MPSLGQSTLARIDSLCDHYEDAWRAGKPPPIEGVLALLSEPARSELLLQLLLLDIDFRRKAGQSPAPEDYLPRFPEHGKLIRGLFAPRGPALLTPGAAALLDLQDQRMHPLPTSGPFVVGRSPVADLPVRDPACSRSQFRIEFAAGKHTLECVSSSGHTLCDGKPVVGQVVLQSGALIRAGNSQFRFLVSPVPEEGRAEEKPSGMAVTLTATEGPHAGQHFTFTGHDRFLVGRSARAHFRLSRGTGKDLYVSRLHFLIEVNPPLCRLHDAGSRNGTFVNGKRVKCAELKDGDTVRAGHTALSVRIEGAPPGTPTAPVGEFFIPTVAPRAVPHALTACPGCQWPGAPAGALLCPACQGKADKLAQPLPDYVLLGELGRGGMGTVHLAVSRATAQLLAVKTVVPASSPSPLALERFLREADILRQLDHPRIVRFRDMGACGGHLFFAMDYINGTDLARLLASRGKLPAQLACGLACQVLEALEHAHERGFVHRDIKPANVLLEVEGKRRRVKLADFGLARVYEASQLSGLTMLNDVGGTPGYLPPEQLTDFRNARPPADQYSTAATLYHMLTGRHVYDLPKRFTDLLPMILGQPPVPLRDRDPTLPEELARVVHRALQRNPEKRFPDVRAFRKALKPFTR